MLLVLLLLRFFFFTDPATTEIYTLSLHDALPISPRRPAARRIRRARRPRPGRRGRTAADPRHPHRYRRGCRGSRSEEHTSELQSHSDLVCRLLLEKKKNTKKQKCQIEYRDKTTTK